jgi:uncharacterized membrane protein YoaK (UPF0700 family)
MTSPSTFTIWLPVTLSITAGAVDVIAFLALGGLFTAHITGNLVVVAAHYATGAFRQAGPLLVVPVFVLVLGVVVLWFGQPHRQEYSRRALLTLHMTLLFGCVGAGFAFGPFEKSNSAAAVATGMLAVAAMATQNALVKLSLVNAPSTAVMTTNATQLIIDLVALARSGESQSDGRKVRQRATVTFACIVGFVGGCVAGAILESHFGVVAMTAPAVLAFVSLLLGELNEQQSFVLPIIKKEQL